MADRAGRQMEHLRRAGKAALLGNGMENPVFKQRHGGFLLRLMPFFSFMHRYALMKNILHINVHHME